MSFFDWLYRQAPPAREKCVFCKAEYDTYEMAAHIPSYGWIHQRCYIPALKQLLERMP
mgnify:CR=1 FL=1